jgi:outer membrane PBP1 activator LpoA protein
VISSQLCRHLKGDKFVMVVMNISHQRAALTFAVAGLALGLVMAACSKDDKSGDSSTSASASSATSSATAAASSGEAPTSQRPISQTTHPC